MKDVRLPSFWETMDRIQATLRLSSAELGSMAGLTEQEFVRQRQARTHLKVTSVMELTRRLNVGFDALMSGTLDYAVLAEHFSGNALYIPEKYTVAAFSRRRNLLPVLKYVETGFGWRHRQLLLERFQINEGIFSQPDEPINFHLSADILGLLFRQYQSPAMLYSMGKLASEVLKGSPFSKELRNEKSASALLEKSAGQLTNKYIERNFLWSIDSLSSDRIRISGINNPELLESMPAESASSVATCHYRAGSLASHTVHGGFGYSRVRKLSCLAQGDRQCTYEIFYPPDAPKYGSQALH